MSTRGIIGFRCNDTDKLIYNHEDSQPDSLGLKILSELRGVENWNVVMDRIESLVLVPEQRRLDEHSSMAEVEVRRAFPELEYKESPRSFYDLFRPLQGTLQPYLDGKLMFMPNALDFIQNSLFCEWGYIANLDSEKFEIWRGFQTKPDPGNWYGTEHDRMGYYPCQMIKEYELRNLPEPVRYLQDYFFYKELNPPM